MRSAIVGVFVASNLFVGSAQAEGIGLGEYLETMDQTEVTFQGYINYDKSSLNDADFTYYNTDGKPFAVTMDAGRKTRERVENECSNASFMISLKELCEISGLGTVEIRGSRIYLSIDELTDLNLP